MTDETINTPGSVRHPAVLLVTGQVAYVASTLLHAGGNANDHHAIFGTYAANAIWTSVHLAQFLAMAMMIGGLFALNLVVYAGQGAAKSAARLGAGAALAALALFGGLQAVDGVALKHAVTAWASAPEAEMAARFASAESIRWLEWGMRSYFDFTLGSALLLSALAAALSARFSRGVAFLIGLTGVAYLAQGWIAGSEGFTDTQSTAIVASWVLGFTWMAWLALSGTRTRDANLLDEGERIPTAAL